MNPNSFISYTQCYFSFDFSISVSVNLVNTSYTQTLLFDALKLTQSSRNWEHTVVSGANVNQYKLMDTGAAIGGRVHENLPK